MTLQSTRLAAAGGVPRLLGTLTVRDVTRPVSLLIQHYTTRPDAPGSLLVRASTKIDRNDFGVTAARGLVERYVEVSMKIVVLASFPWLPTPPANPWPGCRLAAARADRAAD